MSGPLTEADMLEAMAGAPDPWAMLEQEKQRHDEALQQLAQARASAHEQAMRHAEERRNYISRIASLEAEGQVMVGLLRQAMSVIGKFERGEVASGRALSLRARVEAAINRATVWGE